MDPAVLHILFVIGAFCLGLALVIGHAVASRILAIGGTILIGVVLVADLIPH